MQGNTNIMERAVKAGKILLGLFAAYYIILFVVLGLIRSQAFMEYGWTDGSNMLLVHRILEGKALYTAPSLEYVPPIRGPLYPYISSVFAYLFGESYAVLRLVSLAATLGAQFIIGMLVWKKTGSKFAAWLSAGIYAGMFGVTDYSFDAARVDSLSVFFVLAMVYLLWIACEEGGAAGIWAACAALCAVLTKQTALIPVCAMSLWGLIIKNRKTRIAAILCLSAVFFSQAVPAITGNNWFYYYLYKAPSAHPLLLGNVTDFLHYELFRYLTIACFLSLFAPFVLLEKDRGKERSAFMAFFLLSMMTAGLAPRFKIAGDVNNLIPFVAAIAVCCGLTADYFIRQKGWRSGLVILLLLGLNLQIFYVPNNALPSQAALTKTRIELDLFRNLDGPVFAPCHPYLPILAGKNESAFWSAIGDFLQTPGEEREHFEKALESALEKKYYKSVVLLDEFYYMQDRFPYASLEANYRKQDPANISAFKSAEDLPLTVYIPKP
jgi:4-amino-4-deoxy-L-arabinose transferase-like glycosyltransferase